MRYYLPEPDAAGLSTSWTVAVPTRKDRPMIDGLFETNLNVTDLERSMHFYGEVLGLELAQIIEDSRVAFYWIGGRGESMLGIWEKPADEVQRQHIAFRSSFEAIVQHSVRYLNERQLPIRDFMDADADGPMVFGWMPAIAIFFPDPDGHSLEMLAMLPDEPNPEAGFVSWETWQALQSIDS